MLKDKDELRKEYQRADFAKLERGKFHQEVAAGTSVVLLDPEVAKAFPTSAAVNEALLGLLALTEKNDTNNWPYQTGGTQKGYCLMTNQAPLFAAWMNPGAMKNSLNAT